MKLLSSLSLGLLAVLAIAGASMSVAPTPVEAQCSSYEYNYFLMPDGSDRIGGSGYHVQHSMYQYAVMDGGGACGGEGNITTPTASLTTSPSSVVQGSSSVLTWGSLNATSCTGTNFNTGNATSGSLTVAPTTTTTYSVSCVKGLQTVSAQATLTVTNLAPTASLSANPTTIVRGNSSTLSWSSTNATSCTGTNFNTGNATSGSVAVAPTTNTTYSVSCTGAGGTTNASTAVTVTVPQCSDGIDNDNNGVTDLADTGCTGPGDTTESGGATPSVSCVVNPTSTAVGGSATYTATAANGATGPYTWTASDGLSGLGSGNTATRSFGGMGAYGMTVRATAGNNPSTTCPQVSVNSCSGTKAGDINATPTRVNQGSTATLSWNAQNITTSCVIAGPGVSQTIPASSCTVPGTASFTTPAITTQSVYTLTCDGVVLDTAIVNVVPEIEEF